jgi:outer membrane receptor protein involved in Fe transport
LPNRYLNYDAGDAAWLGIDVTLGHQLGKHRITAGATYEYSLHVDQRNYDIGGAMHLDDHRTPWLAAVYAEADLRLGPKIDVRLGGRVDHFDAYGTGFSPRAAAIYSISPRTALKYIFGRAFRAPNAYETYYADEIGQQANLHLQPEHIQSHELVFEHHFTPWLQFTGDAFYSQLRNLIDEVENPSTAMTQFINQGRDRSRGVAFEVETKRASGLALRASYTLTDARDEILHARLTNSPLHLAKFDGTLPVAYRGFAALELLYSSSEESYQQTRVPSYLLTNFTISTKPIRNAWEFSASLYNAFDHRWYSPAGPSFAQADVAQDGRTFRIKLLYRVAPEGKSKP